MKTPLHILLAVSCLFLVSCSTVSVTRTQDGALHAGVTSFLGKQGINKATVTTREGDTITLDGYGTANPDPELTKTVTNGVLINTGMKLGKDLAQPVADAAGAAIPAAN